MLRGGIRLVAVLVVAVLAAGLLVACGGGDDSSTTTAPSTDPGTASSSEGSAAKDGSGSERQDGADTAGGGEGSGGPASSDSKVNPVPLRVSGGGSEQFRTPGGDNSIQDFGEEADESELEEAATALHGYLVAKAEGEWAEACSYLTSDLVEQLGQLAARAELKNKGCPSAMAKLTPPTSASALRETTEIDAHSLRFDGEQAFLIYSGAADTGYVSPMRYEDDTWKVGGLVPTTIG